MEYSLLVFVTRDTLLSFSRKQDRQCRFSSGLPTLSKIFLLLLLFVTENNFFFPVSYPQEK